MDQAPAIDAAPIPLKRLAVVVGGGLAGMSCALALARGGFRVLILEAGGRLGGKAGADLVGGRVVEHGLHLFPPWYSTMFGLMRDIGAAQFLTPVNNIHVLRRHQYPWFRTINAPTHFRSVVANLTSGHLFPFKTAWRLYRSILELALASDGAPLDSMTVADFFRSRSYGSEDTVHAIEEIIPKLVATSSTELSALSWRHAVRGWLTHRSPVFYILSGDLQRCLILPFERTLLRMGVELKLNARVTRLLVDGGRVRGVAVAEQGNVMQVVESEVLVLATPPSVTLRLVSPLGVDAVGLRGLADLRTTPMGVLTLETDQPIAHLPSEHIVLHGSRFCQGLVDLTRLWNHGAQLVAVSVNVTSELRELSPSEAKHLVLAELADYLPLRAPRLITWSHLRTNLDEPLFVNAAGSWRLRPNSGRTRLANLFVCGDYCKTEANIVSMEGAVWSGLEAGRAILKLDG